MRTLLSVLLLFASPVLASDRFVKLDGSKVHYQSYGKGKQAVVFIHGWTCDLTFWRLQSPVYEKRRSLLIDLPGHGKSDKPDVSYTQDLFARAVEAVMRDAKVEKAILVGHSMGTPVALQFLRAYPNKVAGLVMVDAFIPRPPKDDAEKQKQADGAAAMSKIYRAPDYRTATNKMIDSMFTPQTPVAIKDEIRSKMLATPQKVVASAMEGMMALKPLTETWPQVPTLAIVTKRPNRTFNYEEFLRGVFPKLRYVEYEGAGHFLMMEQPDKFNAALSEFLESSRRVQHHQRPGRTDPAGLAAMGQYRVHRQRRLGQLPRPDRQG
ncbi:MAG: alpha/beta hydrolase [Acidobacteria bacterium]|nr:alpha/beta hydrolase [Acidobacteriota bacterium]